MDGTSGAVVGPEAGAAKYVADGSQVAPSHDETTPGPVDSDKSATLLPPPAARQNTSEMQEVAVKPPAGGRVVAGRDQPTTGTTGVGTVVGTAEGSVLVVAVGNEVVEVVVGIGLTVRTSCVEVQAVTATATATNARAALGPGVAPVPSRRRPSTCPPSGIA